MSSKYVDLLEEGLGALVARALDALQFGSVEIFVHDGRVVHIERRERLRLGAAGQRLPDNRRPNPENHRTDRSPGGSDTDDGETSR